MVALVTSALKDAEEDESSRHRGIEDAEEDQGGNHERKGDLFVELVAQGPKSRRRIVLCSGVDVHDRTDQTEDDDLRNRDSPQSLGKVLGILHLRNEARNGNLSDKGVADVQKSIHGADKSRTGRWDDQDNGIASLNPRRSTTRCIKALGVLFNSSKDGRQKD